MKMNDEIEISVLISEVEHYGIKKIKEVEKKFRQKGVVPPKYDVDERFRLADDKQESNM